MQNLTKVNYLVIHHSATVSGNVDIFRDYHINVKHWSDVGYHFVICNGEGGEDGLVQIGRAENKQGAHCPSLNSQSLGICLVGNFEEDKPTEAQIISLENLLITLCSKYNLDPISTILGHKDATSTTCPGRYLYKMIPSIRKRVSR